MRGSSRDTNIKEEKKRVKDNRINWPNYSGGSKTRRRRDAKILE